MGHIEEIAPTALESSNHVGARDVVTALSHARRHPPQSQLWIRSRVFARCNVSKGCSVIRVRGLLRKGVYQLSALLPDSRIKQYIQRPERTHELARIARRFSGRIGPQIG
jgi:hypothetical protein